jgi:SAM-dependent methyltransferase
VAEAGLTAPAHAEGELWDLEQLAGARGLCDWMFAQVEDVVGPRVAEVGAGIGTFTGRLLDAGAEQVLAIEPEPACAAELSRRFGSDPRVQVASETLPQSPSLDALAGACDLVLCQNVLEHIEDDEAAVRAMGLALRPGGTLVLLVPAHPRLYGALDRGYGHFRRYDRARLRRLAGAAGLHLDRLYSFNLLGIAGWWAKNRRGASAIGAGSLRAYEALLRVWRPVEDRLDLPVGLSLIARASRPRPAG